MLFLLEGKETNLSHIDRDDSKGTASPKAHSSTDDDAQNLETWCTLQDLQAAHPFVECLFKKLGWSLPHLDTLVLLSLSLNNPYCSEKLEEERTFYI